AELRRTAAEPRAELKRRQEALTALLEARDKDLVPVLHGLVGEPPLRGAALRGLANYDDPKTPPVILSAYPSLSVEEKRDALNTLASRAVYGKALLEALGAKKIPAAEVPAEVVRQLRNLNDKDLDARIAEVWGIIRTTPADRLKMIAQYRQMLTK